MNKEVTESYIDDLREDKVEKSLPRKDVLAFKKENDGVHIIVPQILE